MTGETQSQQLYSLPHRAYKERTKPDLKTDTADTMPSESKKNNNEENNEESEQCDVDCENNKLPEVTDIKQSEES